MKYKENMTDEQKKKLAWIIRYTLFALLGVALFLLLMREKNL